MSVNTPSASAAPVATKQKIPLFQRAKLVLGLQFWKAPELKTMLPNFRSRIAAALVGGVGLAAILG